MAVPFGSPVFCCYYRADLLEKLGRRPPKTWAEYHSLAKLLAKISPLPLEKAQNKKNSPRPLGEGQGVRAWCGTIEPLAPGWAGDVLLARAAAYAKHRDNFSTLFDIETMEPLVSGPPFVQALEGLVAAAKLGPADPLRYDPASARAAFWAGRCGMALAWPTAAQEGRGERGERRGERDGQLSAQWAVGSGQWAVGTRQSAVGSGQSALGSRQSAVGSGQSALGSRQSAVGSRQSAVGSGQWAMALSLS